MHRRTSSKGSHDRNQLLSNVNSQLQQYKQRMQLLHQQLIVGQQKMKEVQGQQPPQPQLVAQYQRKLQQGIQQYRQLEVGQVAVVLCPPAQQIHSSECLNLCPHLHRPL